MRIKNIEKKLLSQLIIAIVFITVQCVILWRKYVNNQELDSSSEPSSDGVSMSFGSLE